MNEHDRRRMCDFIAGMKNGEAVEFTTPGNDLLLVKRTFTDLHPRLTVPGTVGLIGLEDRPGVEYLQRYLELKYFPIKTPRNDLLQCFLLRWIDLLWCLTVFPYDSLNPFALRDALERAGLRARQARPIAQLSQPPALAEGTIPCPDPDLFGQGWVEMDLPGMLMTLENLPGHLCYRDPAAADAREQARIVALEAECGVSR